MYVCLGYAHSYLSTLTSALSSAFKKGIYNAQSGYNYDTKYYYTMATYVYWVGTLHPSCLQKMRL